MVEEIINFEKALAANGENRKILPQVGINVLFSFEHEQPVVKWGVFPNDDIDTEQLRFDTEHLEKCGNLYQYVTGLIRNKRHDTKKHNESCSPFAYILKLEAIEKIRTDSDWGAFVDDFNAKSSRVFDVQKHDDIANEFAAFISFLKNQDGGFLSTTDHIVKSIDSYNAGSKRKVKKIEKLLLFFDAKETYYQEAQLNSLGHKPIARDDADSSTDQIVDEGVNFQDCDWLYGFSDKKEFLQHRTAAFDKCHKIRSDQATIVNSFFAKLKARDVFPKPLPIFIVKEELNNKVVRIFGKNKMLTFADIFDQLYSTTKNYTDDDLSNYYLLYAQIEKKKLVVKDFEFVPSFIYKTNYEFETVFEESPQPQSVETIFDFQRQIVRDLFDNCLVRKDEKTGIYTHNYWGEIKAKYCKTDNNYRLILQYRKAFYDFIYKSKEGVITGSMLKDIILSSVMDTLHDENYRAENRAKESRIKRLLDIYFNLNMYFDNENNNFNKITTTMVQKTKELLEKIRDLADPQQEKYLEADTEFAFCFGQLVYYLLSQSEASKKTHSLLLAYLQKADFGMLKLKAREDITKYAYKISFNNKKFNKISSEVLGYLPVAEFDDLVSFFLAGYFSKNVIY
jgi:CRISPR-associated protein Csh1